MISLCYHLLYLIQSLYVLAQMYSCILFVIDFSEVQSIDFEQIN